MGNTKAENNFIMCPKIDFAFKLIFGDIKNKDILIDFLCNVLKVPTNEFEGIEIINNDLPREFKEDKKGILDVRVKTAEGRQIDIEIQIIPSKHMTERTLYYWAKMYTGQIKSGNEYTVLKKCITINILDYVHIPIDRIHTKFQLLECETYHKLTDVQEIHFLELPKLGGLENVEDTADPLIYWLEFINADTKGVMEVLAEKDENIRKAYDILQIMSKDEKARMAYEARQAAIMDEATRLSEAKEEGMKQGIEKGRAEGMEKEKVLIAKEALKNGGDIDFVAKITKLDIKVVSKIAKELHNS